MDDIDRRLGYRLKTVYYRGQPIYIEKYIFEGKVRYDFKAGNHPEHRGCKKQTKQEVLKIAKRLIDYDIEWRRECRREHEEEWRKEDRRMYPLRSR